MAIQAPVSEPPANRPVGSAGPRASTGGFIRGPATGSAAETPASDAAAADALSYRALHNGALAGLLIGAVSLVFPLSISGLADARNALLLGAIPAVGLLVSLVSLRKIRSAPDLYAGGSAAAAGAVIAALSLIAGGGYGGYVYATEVPEGYTRTSFSAMKPDAVEIAGRQPVPKDVAALLGEKVFIKGFMREDSTNNGLTRGVSEFLLVRDNAECCFGELSDVEFYDQVSVKLRKGLTTNLARRVYRLGGELSVRAGEPARGEPELVYELRADYCK